MPKAKPSPRVLNKVDLVCALLQIPISIYNGHDDKYKGFERHTWLPVEKTTGKGKSKKTEVELHPVGKLDYDKETGQPLTLAEQDAVVTLVETEHGKVYVDDEEVLKALNLDPNTLEIQSFQPLALYASGEHYFPKKLMYIEPGKVEVKGRKVVAPRAATALSALLQEMREKGVMAVCELTTRELPKPCILLPDGRLIQVQHTEALREQRELDDLEVDDKTRALVDNLIDSLLTTEPADLDDKKSALVYAHAQEKAENGDFSFEKSEAPAPAEPEDIVDFTTMLERSIAEAKKKPAKKKASA